MDQPPGATGRLAVAGRGAASSSRLASGQTSRGDGLDRRSRTCRLDVAPDADRVMARLAGSLASGVPVRSDLLDLTVFELDRGRPAEDGDRHLEAGAALVDFLDDAVEGGEGAVRRRAPARRSRS